jgi:hypothetical protein
MIEEFKNSLLFSLLAGKSASRAAAARSPRTEPRTR